MQVNPLRGSRATKRPHRTIQTLIFFLPVCRLDFFYAKNFLAHPIAIKISVLIIEPSGKVYVSAVHLKNIHFLSRVQGPFYKGLPKFHLFSWEKIYDEAYKNIEGIELLLSYRLISCALEM